MTEPLGRRLMAVEATIPLLARGPVAGWGDEWFQVANPLPEDAAFLWSYMAPDGRSCVFVFQHESFPYVPEGSEIPRHALYFRSQIVPAQEERTP